MLSIITFIAGALLPALSYALPQGPNTLAVYNYDERTLGVNGTFFLVAVDTALVQANVPYPLLPIPTDPTAFAYGFPLGKHPILVSNVFASDIRQNALEIDSLLNGAVYVPYVDRLNNKVDAFLWPLRVIVGGFNGQVLSGLVPAVVGTATTGEIVEEGQFLPNNAAYAEISPGEYSAQGKLLVVPNPVSGPGVSPSIYDLLFSTTVEPLYKEQTFRKILNQPIILLTGLCSYVGYYFNETFSDPTLRTGSVTLYSPTLPQNIEGVYTDQGGVSVAGSSVGYLPETCEAAKARVDPASL